MADFRPDTILTALFTIAAVLAILLIVVAMIGLAGQCRIDRKRSKAAAAARRADIERIERAAAFHRAYPHSAKPAATCKPGLHVEPNSTPWVVMPTSDAPQTHGIGDITGKDCGTGTTPTLTTLCTPADVASTPGEA